MKTEKSALETYTSYKHSLLLNGITILSIFSLVYIIWGIISNWNPNIFCYGDNIAQWLPVIDDTYSSLLSSGKLNYWNFYLMGGINILDTGIYSILNPFMFIGYIISHLFGFSNSVSICMYLTTSVAMCIFYYLFRKNGISLFHSIVLIICFLSCSGYYQLASWYYVFNNLLIGSLIVWYFLHIYKYPVYKFYMGGIILGFSIYLGNVQYSVMWYMAFGIIFVILFILNKTINEIIILFSNIGIAILLSFPQLILNLRAAKNTAFEGTNPDFFTNPLSLNNIIIHGIFPDNLLESITGIPFNEYYFSNHFYFVGIFMILFFISLIGILRNDVTHPDHKIETAFSLCIIFFILWSLGPKSIVSYILYKLPIIQSFRFLQKIYYVIIPLLIVPTIFVLKKYHGFNNIFILSGLILALINLEDLYTWGSNMPLSAPLRSFTDEIDVENYKVYAIIHGDENGNYNERIISPLTSTRIAVLNTPAFYHIFTLGGYNLSYTVEQYQTVNYLLNNESTWSEYAWANAKHARDFTLTEESIQQLQNNSVKYIITDSSEVDLQFIEQNNAIIENSIDIGEGYHVLILNGISPIVNFEGNKLAFEPKNNSIIIETDNSSTIDKIKVNFPYNNNYKAYSMKNGIKEPITCCADTNGFIQINNVIPSEQVIIEYKDFMSSLTVLFGLITSCLLFICTMRFISRQTE